MMPSHAQTERINPKRQHAPATYSVGIDSFFNWHPLYFRHLLSGRVSLDFSVLCAAGRGAGRSMCARARRSWRSGSSWCRRGKAITTCTARAQQAQIEALQRDTLEFKNQNHALQAKLRESSSATDALRRRQQDMQHEAALTAQQPHDCRLEKKRCVEDAASLQSQLGEVMAKTLAYQSQGDLQSSWSGAKCGGK